MTKLDNVAQFAKDTCREAMIEAREFQQELGVPETEQCKLPATFNCFRSVERFEALTAEYDAIAAECRATLVAEAKAEAAKPESRLLAAFELTAAHDALRKVCERELANVQRLQRQAGLPVALCRSFKKLSLEELALLENEYHSIADRMLADAKALREQREAAAVAEAGRIKRETEERRQREAKELERKRQREHNAKLQTQYGRLRQPGRTLPPFGVWARDRGYQAVG
ncbi:MAG: hypothetical protein NUW08_00880 [Candidatus Uhrbacteria bacterium]|nr:hypothetical protein [Candidatus Uhrbacteria bacterium]